MLEGHESAHAPGSWPPENVETWHGIIVANGLEIHPHLRLN